MDAFYAAVEEKFDPGLKDVPLAIEERGMIQTTNYKARAFGVRSGVPAFVGKKLCPGLVTKRPDFTKYRAESAKFRDVLAKIDPDLEAIGLDEANLDVTDYLRKHDKMTEEGRKELA